MSDEATSGVEAVLGVMAALAAAISLLERTPAAKKAAPSDIMFGMMLDDYRKALETARAALATPAASPADRKPLRMLVDREGLRDMITQAPDDEEYEARPTPAASPATELQEFKLAKRPVAFLVKAPEETGWRFLYYRDEQNAAKAAEEIGVDYEGLYVRDGTPLLAPSASPSPAPAAVEFYADDEPLSEADQRMIDAAWETHKAAAPAPAPETWRGLDDARLKRAIDAFYDPCEGTTIDGIRNAILAWERG